MEGNRAERVGMLTSATGFTALESIPNVKNGYKGLNNLPLQNYFLGIGNLVGCRLNRKKVQISR